MEGKTIDVSNLNGAFLWRFNRKLGELSVEITATERCQKKMVRIFREDQKINYHRHK